MAIKLKHVPTILLVDDDEDDCAEIKHLLRLSGYEVIDADNGEDATIGARYAHPDLLLVNLCAPLPYELVAARQIVKKAQLGPVPVVLIAKAEETGKYPVELSINNNEYVTRMADYEQLECLLDYLLPIPPTAA